MISAYLWLKANGLELAANALVVLVVRRLTLWLWSHLECFLQFRAHQHVLEVQKEIFVTGKSSRGNNRWMWWWYRLFPKNALENNQRQVEAADAFIDAAISLRALLEVRIEFGGKYDESEEEARLNYRKALSEFLSVSFGPDSGAYFQKIVSGPQRTIRKLDDQLMRRRDIRHEGRADR